MKTIFKTHDCKSDSVNGKLENKFEFRRKLKIKRWEMKEYV